MESAPALKISERDTLLQQWLTVNCALKPVALHALPGDASTRRYFRATFEDHSVIAVDAPPPQNCTAFVAIANALRQQGLRTPDIFHADTERGFLVLSDFGDLTYLKALNQYNAAQYYQQALTALAVLQDCRDVSHWPIPAFTREFMRQEWAWHKEWFLKKYLGLSQVPAAVDHCYELLIDVAVNQPQVFMHRDYHSANLMVLPNDQVGILDFQDAFIGPVTYDAVSLLRDCYVAWPDEWVSAWVVYYWQQLRARGLLANVSEAEFKHWFDWMGLQRHLKALMTFARKNVRDYQPQYLQHIPRTLNYILTISAHYPELRALHCYFHDTVQPKVSTCAL